MSALALGLIAAASWGLHDFCVRFISQKVPITACLLTVLCTGLMFQTLLMIATTGFASLPQIAIAPVIYGGLAFLIANFGLYGAFQRGPVWLAAPLVALFSVFSMGIAVWQGADVSAGQWVAVFVILIGISAIAGLSDDDSADTRQMAVTAIYALICAAGFAATFTFGQAVTELTNGQMSALSLRIIAIFAIVLVIAVGRLPYWPGRAALPVLAVMGLVDGIAIISVVSAGGLPDAQYAAVTTSMYGLPTIWLAATFLGERINAKQWIGCVIAFCAVGYLAL